MDELKKLQSVFQTLSDFNRLSILKSIGDKQCAVGELVNHTGLSQPLVSHHLRTLKENHFLKTQRNGPFIYYSLKDEKILYAIQIFHEIFKDADLKTNSDFNFCPSWMRKKFHF